MEHSVWQAPGGHLVEGKDGLEDGHWSPISQVKMRPRQGRRGDKEENLYLR